MAAEQQQDGPGERSGRAAAALTRRGIGAFLSWFGVVGMAFTIFGNVTSFLTFAKWVRDVFMYWNDIVTRATRFVLDLLPFHVPDEFTRPIFFVVVTLSIAIGARLAGGPPRISIGQRLVAMICSAPAVALALLVGAVMGLGAVWLGITVSPLMIAIGLIVALSIGTAIMIASVRFAARFGVTPDDVYAVFWSYILVRFMAGGESMEEYVLLTVLASVPILLAQGVAVQDRGFAVLKLISAFALVASITLLPVPEGLAISGFFAK